MIQMQVSFYLVCCAAAWHFINKYVWPFPELPSYCVLESYMQYCLSVGFFLFFVLSSGLMLLVLAVMSIIAVKLLIGRH